MSDNDSVFITQATFHKEVLKEKYTVRVPFGEKKKQCMKYEKYM